MSRGVAKVEQATFAQNDDRVTVFEEPLVNLRLDVLAANTGILGQRGHVDLVVEVTDVAKHGVVLHLRHVLDRHDVSVAGRSDNDVGLRDDIVETDNVVALHQCLQCADRIDLGDCNAGTLHAERLGRALADIAEAADNGHLAREHQVDTTVDAVDERVAATVEVVELALGDGVVDIDRREQQRAFIEHLSQTQHARRGLFGDALDAVGDCGPLVSIGSDRGLKQRQEDLKLLGLTRRGVRNRTGQLVLATLVDEHGGVATVVEDHVRSTVGPRHGLLRAPPILLERLALPGVDRNTARLLWRAVRANSNGGSCLILSRKNVAACPANLCTERDQRLDQNGGLDRHVQRARHARAGERLLGGILFAQRHQAGHFVLGNRDLFTTPLGERKVGDAVVAAG